MSLPTRQANQKAILEAIEERRRACSTGTKPTYADVVAPRRPIPSLENPQAALTNPQPTAQTIHTKPTTPKDKTINDASGENQSTQPFASDESENPWVLVTRRKHQNLKPESHAKPKRSKYIAKLIEEQRCFKCLDRGHTQFQCRNGVRCINCKGIGHISKWCTIKGAQGKPKFDKQTLAHPLTKTPPQPYTKNTPNIHTSAPTAHHQPMELENWETMALEDPEYVNAGRNAELRIFFPPNDDIRSPNTLLNRSAVVLVGPHIRLRQMPYRIANALATTMRRHPGEFSVSAIEPAFGDYLVTFTSNMMRNMAVYAGTLMVAQGAYVQLRAWSPNLAMVRDPTTHVARIRFHGVPLQYWNLPDINHLVSGFGYVERMSSVVTNGNFSELRALVACFNPVNVPPSLWLFKSPYSKIVHLTLEGWVRNDDIPFYPPHDSDGDDDSDDEANSSATTMGARGRPVRTDQAPPTANREHQGNRLGQGSRAALPGPARQRGTNDQQQGACTADELDTLVPTIEEQDPPVLQTTRQETERDDRGHLILQQATNKMEQLTLL